MNLRMVTFTGADEQTDVAAMEALSRQYPFIEWGILFSSYRSGREPRYPGLAKMERFGQIDGHLSVHLCGRLAREAAAGEGYPVQAALQFVRKADRVQINLGTALDQYPDLWSRLRLRAPLAQFILQAYSFAGPSVQTARSKNGWGRVVFLCDASGGRGVPGPFEKPVNEDIVGFAGGLTPENVESKLHEIEALGFEQPFWIDMETGVRTDNWFDLAKVERICRLVQPYIQEGGLNVLS